MSILALFFRWSRTNRDVSFPIKDTKMSGVDARTRITNMVKFKAF
jgi:hypothetical protein